jgi:hypothetical protein
LAPSLLLHVVGLLLERVVRNLEINVLEALVQALLELIDHGIVGLALHQAGQVELEEALGVLVVRSELHLLGVVMVQLVLNLLLGLGVGIEHRCHHLVGLGVQLVRLLGVEGLVLCSGKLIDQVVELLFLQWGGFLDCSKNVLTGLLYKLLDYLVAKIIFIPFHDEGLHDLAELHQ